jgi:hypothetical protein
VLGVPLVAIGITTTRLGFTPLLESFAVTITVLAATATAILHGRLALQRGKSPLVHTLWGVAALSLLSSMILALLYGWRPYLPVAFLDIPWMRALHGTTNAFGFGLAGILAWHRS